jgi:hypothetical protein
MKKSRKLILARNDLVEEAAKITAKDGRTLFSFTNEVFEWAIEAYNNGVTPAEALEFYKMMVIGKNLGHVIVPSEVLYNMTKDLYEVQHEKLLEKWYESGVWNGNYLSIKFQENDQIEILKKFMKASLWNIDEFSLDFDEDNNRMKIRCYSPKLSKEITEMLAKFLEGMLFSMGYSVRNNKLLRGLIMLKLEKRKSEDPQSKILLEAKS